jgi:hypothetical protein
MRTISFIAVLALVASAGLPVHAAVEVTYGDPDKFSDAGDRNTDPRQIMKVLSDRMKATGDKILPPGTSLKIEVLDLDRAGRPRGNLPTDIRIVRGKGDMPCIDLRYSLDGAAPVRERVCDPDFLRPLGFSYDEHDPVVYEKRMLDTWFEKRFGKGDRPR